MHRQSLGSPSSKQHANGASSATTTTTTTAAVKKEKEESHIIANSSAIEIQNHILKHKLDENEKDDDEGKRKLKSQSHITNAQKFVVHLIPLLILLCILILFLFSHKGGLEEEFLAVNLDVKRREQILRVMKVGDRDILGGIQSMRNLQGDSNNKKFNFRLHRKIGDFKADVV